MPVPGILLSDDVVQLTAFKRAEDSENYVIRLFEPSGQARTTTLTIPALDVEHVVKLKAFEIKTFLFVPQTRTFTETNLLERPIAAT